VRSGGTDPGDWLVTAFLLAIIALGAVVVGWAVLGPGNGPLFP
jgi:hypothetical protein